jgi:hypothetical protein
VIIENTIAVSSCGSFQGQPFTHHVDPCRAGGTALFLVLRAGARALVTNCTISGEGDVLVGGECDSLYSSCNGQERIVLRNNICIGNTEFLSPDDISALMYQETFPQGDQLWDVDYSVIRHVKDAACPGTHHTCGEAAVGLVNEGIDTFDAHLLPTSPARDAGTPVGAPSVDFEGHPRDAQPDIGAYEFTSGGGGTCTLSCSASAPSAGLVGQALSFSATVTPSGCPAGSPAVAWSFGDGTTSTDQNPVKTYTLPGTYSWSVTASLSGASPCTRSGSITIVPASASCTGDAVTMCLVGGRYKVTSYWRNQYAGGAVSTLKAARLTDATGAFYVSDGNVYEYLIRINTATDNGRAWIAIPTFTDVEFFITVQDVVNGQTNVYHSPPGNRTLIYDPLFFVYP